MSATIVCRRLEQSFMASKADNEFSGNYARAREIQGLANAALAIEAATNAKDAGLGRLAYDALKWHAARLAPKVYGDKTEVAVVGPNGGPVQSQSVTVSTADPIEAARVYQKVMSESQRRMRSCGSWPATLRGGTYV